MRRVVVTGMAGYSPVGNDWEEIKVNLQSGTTGVQYMPDWEKYTDLNTKLGAPVKNFETPNHFKRKQVRSMGRIALMAVASAERALQQAGLLGDEVLTSGKTGVSYGSSTGTPSAVADFFAMFLNHSGPGINANSYLKMMSHTTAVNIGVFFGLRGRVIPTSSACTSGSQGIGYAYEAIKHGYQDVMIAGGAEELCGTEAAVFDTLYATSTKNDAPSTTPSPFDANRDGLVIGEGAGTFILEERERALSRGANILAELVGFSTNSDGAHVTQPQSETMFLAMLGALTEAGCDKSEIGFVSAHGTGTAHGDVAETHATHRLFGDTVPISSFKSYTGHTLGACGALEAMISINMMHDGWFHGTANLNEVDPDCADLDYLRVEGRNISTQYVMSNNFAFGGINTSLVFKLPE